MDRRGCKRPEISGRKIQLRDFTAENAEGSGAVPGRQMKGDT